jgi:hypothetical protein
VAVNDAHDSAAVLPKKLACHSKWFDGGVNVDMLW